MCIRDRVITMKKISIILLSAVLVFSMAACNGGKEKADNQTEKQTESVKPTEEAEMATEAVTELSLIHISDVRRRTLKIMIALNSKLSNCSHLSSCIIYSVSYTHLDVYKRQG